MFDARLRSAGAALLQQASPLPRFEAHHNPSGAVLRNRNYGLVESASNSQAEREQEPRVRRASAGQLIPGKVFQRR